jgi:CheY-like chemotaxis protein
MDPNSTFRVDQKRPKLNGQHRRVLVVDNSELDAFLLSEILTVMGHHVRVARDGVEALQLLDGFNPQVVVSDIHMPRMDGCELAKEVRRRSAAVMLVALTNEPAPNCEPAAQPWGFDLHLSKPFEITALQDLFGTSEHN